MADWIDDEVKAALKTPDFDCFSYTHEQLTEVLAFFYDALGLVEAFGLHRSVIARFVDAVRRNYNDTPFHNFLHCFNVSQMVYVLLTRLQETRGSTEASPPCWCELMFVVACCFVRCWVVGLLFVCFLGLVVVVGCRGWFSSWLVVVVGCRGWLSWLVVVVVGCRGWLSSWLVVVVGCRGWLPWLVVVVVGCRGWL